MNDKIIQTVCKTWNKSLDDVCGKSRNQDVVYTRMTIAYFLRRHTILSTTEIGRLINRNHSTIVHYLKAYDSEFRFNEEFRNFAERIKEDLQDIIKSSFALELEEEFNEIYG